MLTPGAYRSTHDPKFENEACVSSVGSLAATVIAGPSVPPSSDGDDEQALPALLPAATAKETPVPPTPPLMVAVLMALSRSGSVSPAGVPRLMLATAGRTAFAATQSTPAITPESLPSPSQPSTRTSTNETSLA